MNKSATIGSLTVGIQIIDVVAQSEVPLKFTDIQEQTGITKSNLYKYLNTLTQLNLLYRDSKQGSYSLGYKFLEYGNAAMQNTDFIGKLTPYFKEISKLTNMTSLLATWINDSPVITNIWNTNYGLNIGAQIGTKLPLLSAAGKIFAAYGTVDEIVQWIDQEQKKESNLKIADFQKELETIRTQRVAFAHEPLINHVSSWSLPILNYKNELVAVIAVVGFTDQTPKSNESPIVQQVLHIAKEMSKAYGYQENNSK